MTGKPRKGSKTDDVTLPISTSINDAFPDNQGQSKPTSGSTKLANNHKPSFDDSSLGIPANNKSEKVSGYGLCNNFDPEIREINDLSTNFREKTQKYRVQRLLEMWDIQIAHDHAQEDSKHIDSMFEAPEAKKQKRSTKLKKPHLTEAMQKFINNRNKDIQLNLQVDVEEQKNRKKKRKAKREEQDKDDEEARCKVFKENDYGVTIWNNSVLILAVVNAVAVPLELTVYRDLSENTTYIIIDLIINAIFLLDVLINFNTSFFSAEGELIRARKDIAINYMFHGAFFIDFFSSIPYSLIGLKSLKFMKILKIFRITRLSKVIEKMTLEEDSKAGAKILKLIFELFLIMHLLGCSWFYVVAIYEDNNYWSPPLDFIWVSRPTYYRFYDSDEVSPLYQYLVCLYTAVLALGGNEMGPRTNVEIMTMFGILIFLTMYNALIFGDMTVLVSQVTAKASKFQDQIDVANTAMNNMDLPSDARNNVRTYLITTQGTQHEQTQLKEFLQNLSPSLQEQVAIAIFAKVANKVYRINALCLELGKQSEAYLQNPTKSVAKQQKALYIMLIVSQMKTDLREPDKVVIDQLQQGEALYLIAKGECQVSIEDDNSADMHNKKKRKSNREKPNPLRPGHYFGEISLIYDCPCTAKVTATKYCTLAKLEKENFKALCKQIPQLQEQINKGIYDYDDKMLRFIKKSMSSVPYLNNLDTECSYDIIYSLTTKKKNKGDILQKRGSDADELYFLQSGIIEVYTQFEGKEFVIERLFRGSIINYRTFFMEDRAICELRFAANSILKALKKERMEQICAKYPRTLGKTFSHYKLKIIKEQRSIPLDYVMVLPNRITNKIKKATRRSLQSTAEFHRALEAKKAEMKAQGHKIQHDDEVLFSREIVTDKDVTKHMQRAFDLENMLKNVTIRQIVKIREVKDKRTLKEAVEKIQAQRKEEDQKRRKKIQRKFTRENEDMAAKDDKDPQYGRIMNSLDRLLKILTTHSSAIDQLEKRLNTIEQTRGKPSKQVQNNLVSVQEALKEDQLLNTGEIKGLPRNPDDLEFMDKEEMERDAFMDGMNAGYEPKAELMKDYHIPLENQKQIKVDVDGESLQDESSNSEGDDGGAESQGNQ